jgi:hypothetical protein
MNNTMSIRRTYIRKMDGKRSYMKEASESRYKE